MDLDGTMNKYGLGKSKVAGSKFPPKKHPSTRLSPKAKGKKKLITPTKKSSDSPKHKKSPASRSPQTQAKCVKGPPTKRKKEVPQSSESVGYSGPEFQPESCANSDSNGPSPKKVKNTPRQSTGKKEKYVVSQLDAKR